MYQKLRGFFQGHKRKAVVAMTLVALILTITAVVVFMNEQHSQLASDLLPSLPVPTNEVTPVSNKPMIASQTPNPSTASSATSTLFRYTDCPVGVTFNPEGVDDSGFSRIEQPQLPKLTHIRTISAGQLFDGAGYGLEMGTSYALADDGSLFQWGYLNSASGAYTSSYPRKVEGIEGTVLQLSGRFTLTHEGNVYELNENPIPRKIKELSGSIYIAQAGEASVFAVDKSNTLQLYSLYEQNGQPQITSIENIGHIQTISSSPSLTLFQRQDGSLFMSTTPNLNTYEQIKLPNGEKVAFYQATMSHQEKAYIQSDNGHWYLINENNQLLSTVVPNNAVQVTAMEQTSFALMKDGTVWTWGLVLQDPNLPQKKIAPDQAHPISGLSNITSLAVGSNHLLALTNEGTVQSLGSNMYGQLGRLSIFEKQLVPYGVWNGLDALFPVYDRLFGIKQGDVWSLKGDGTTQPVLLGQKAKKAIAALGNYFVLTEDGKVFFADVGETLACKMIEGPAPVLDVDSTMNGLILALNNGRSFYLEGSPQLLNHSEEMQLDPKPTGRVTQVFGFPIPFVLTDKGELYYQQRVQDGGASMKPIRTNTPVRQWSPMSYVYFDGSTTLIGKVLDLKKQIYEISMELDRTADANFPTARVEVKKTKETGVRLNGGAVIKNDGHIIEDYNHIRYDTSIPPDSNLIIATSKYIVPIEGRSSWYHVYVTKDGTMYWQGDLPYTGPNAAPGLVRLPR